MNVHAFSYEWFGTKTRFARVKSQLFIHELLREPLISKVITEIFHSQTNSGKRGPRIGKWEIKATGKPRN